MQRIGPYQIVEELGRGAMGIVFRGMDQAIGRPVAIKVIRSSEFASAEESAALKLRFAREAAAAGKLAHPNIVVIYHLGEEPGFQYLAMELVPGESLERLLRGRPPMDAAIALPLLAQAAGALDYAHREGVVHRDIKPANIMVRPDGTIKVTDFGVARISSQTVTQSGMTMGTPAYMAPEQIMAARVDGRADQFSLAVMAFEMLTGRKPFEAQSNPALIFQIASEPPRIAHEVNPALPRGVTEVLCKALAKQKEDRYETCTAFVDALARAVAGREASVAAATPAPVCRRTSYARWGAAALAAIAGATGAAYLSGHRGQGPAAAVPVQAAVAAEAPARPQTLRQRAPRRIRVDGNVQQAKIVRQGKPAYPPLAKQARISGVVRLRAVIGKDGAIQSLALISGHPLLVPAALDAAKGWLYQPTLVNGEPVEVATELDIRFTLVQ